MHEIVGGNTYNFFNKHQLKRKTHAPHNKADNINERHNVCETDLQSLKSQTLKFLGKSSRDFLNFFYMFLASRFGFNQILSSYYSQCSIFVLTVFAIFLISSLVHSIVMLNAISATSTDHKISCSISISSLLSFTDI